MRLADDGEILVRGPNVFAGYWERPAATADAFVAAADGGPPWFRTGDVGADEDGYLVIRGRSKELIITGGFNVYPAEVEDVLVAHPGVAEVAVTGTPVRRVGRGGHRLDRGRRPPALPRRAGRTSSPPRLAAYKRPRRVHVVDSLPRNALGKVRQGQLGWARDRFGSMGAGAITADSRQRTERWTAGQPPATVDAAQAAQPVGAVPVRRGFGVVAGLDEVGRGAWAGPVSVGVVVFPLGVPRPEGLRDSKMLTEERAGGAVPPGHRAGARDWSVGHAGAVECDRLGMTAALRLAARRALSGLAWPPQVVVMDGAFDYVSEPCADRAGPRLACRPRAPQVRTVVRGDATCVSIAAASIVAKVTRDRLMRTLSASFPAFDFDRNKGYPSPVHRTALAGFGLTSVHRRSWSYVDDLAFR